MSASNHSCYAYEPSMQYNETTNGSAITSTMVQISKLSPILHSLQDTKSLPYLNTTYNDPKHPANQEDHTYQLPPNMIGSDIYVTRNDRDNDNDRR